MRIKRRVLLALLILIWGVSWPAIKVGIASVPPLWYACLRYSIAAVCLFAWVGSRRKLALPPRSDWALVAIFGVLQMATYSALTGFALTVLSPGRASVLAFSTPVWVLPLAVWSRQERFSHLGLIGMALGIAGTLTIAFPSILAYGIQQFEAYALLLGAAAAWAVSIVFVPSHRFTATPLALAPWQMLIAAGLLLPVAILVEGQPPSIDARGAASLGYVGPVATAFAYWAVVELGRRVPATTMSMALLAVPTVGILISSLTLGETIGPSLIAGAGLIVAGIGCVTRPPQRKAVIAFPARQT